MVHNKEQHKQTHIVQLIMEVLILILEQTKTLFILTVNLMIGESGTMLEHQQK